MMSLINIDYFQEEMQQLQQLSEQKLQSLVTLKKQNQWMTIMFLAWLPILNHTCSKDSNVMRV